MRIKLDDKHWLNSDSFNYWITCEYETKTGKIAERLVSGYCYSMARAVEKYIEKKIASSEATSIAALSKEMEELKEEVRVWIRNCITS